MKDVFESKIAKCRICGSETTEKYKRGNKFYCTDHYESESTEEQNGNRQNRKTLRKFKKLFG